MEVAMATKKRAALYLRVSTDDQHPENQLPDLRRCAEQRGLLITEEYVDHGESGAKARRPALDRLMDDARRGRLDVVLCWSISRFGRSMVNSVLAMHELTVLGVALIFVQESIDTGSIVGRGIAALLAALAEQDLEERRARVRAGISRARAAGKRWGRPNNHRVDADIVSDLLDAGLTYAQAADRLGVPKTTLYRQFKKARSEKPAPTVNATS
jgi:putative DNA-invertase from lambdoid prophage Rac